VTKIQKLSLKTGNFIGGKKKASNHIAPLQPPTLASFPTWGDSEGAGRVTLAGRKYKYFLVNSQARISFFAKNEKISCFNNSETVQAMNIS